MAHAFIAPSDVSRLSPYMAWLCGPIKTPLIFTWDWRFVILESYHSDPTTLMYLPMKDILAAFE